MATPVPTRQTDEAALDQWNRALRASPLYQNFLKRHGLVDTGRGVTLSRSQQAALERELASAGMPLPSGMHIDQGGNLNQKNTLVKKAAIGAAIGGAALTGLGAAGIGPLSGAFGAGAGAAGAAGSAAAAGGGAVIPTLGGAGISSWLTPLLSYGIPAATGLVATRMQANADRDATRMQTDYLDRALAVEQENQQWNRGQRADYLARLKPYDEAGVAAVGRATDFLTNRYRPDAMAGGPLVALRDSRGEVRQVPAAEADRYLQMGAQRV